MVYPRLAMVEGVTRTGHLVAAGVSIPYPRLFMYRAAPSTPRLMTTPMIVITVESKAPSSPKAPQVNGV